MVLEGTGNSKATAAHFYAKGLKLRSDGGVFAQIKTFGAPSRLGLFENIEAVGFKIVLSFNPENLDSQYGTIYGNFHINDCNIYECQQFIYAKGKDDLKPSLCNLKIENSVIEHGGKNQIELNNIFGYTEISNNILEGQEIPISVSIQKGHLSIIGNYFEQNGICANIQGLSPDLSSVSFSNNFFHENDPDINLTNLTIDFSTQDGIKRTKINTVNCVSKDNTILLNDRSSSLTISGSKQKIPSLKPGMKLIEIGSETIGNDIYGKKTLDTKLTFLSEINISIKKGDILLLSFYKSEGLLQFGFYDRVVGAPAADTGYVTSNASGIICVKTVALQNLDKIGFHACSMEENDKVSISNGVITNISNLKNYSTEDYCGVIK